MLFLQPVVVNDASAADRPAAAEVWVMERAAEPPEWTGPMLAQAPSDQRSPFGAGAPDKNDVTPPPNIAPPNPASNVPAPDDTGNGPFADPASKKVPPPPARPDAGPPPPTGKFTNHTDTIGPLAQGNFLGGSTAPGTNPNANAPGTVAPGGGTNVPGSQNAAPTTVPGTPPSTTTPGTPATPGAISVPGGTPLPETTPTGAGGTSGITTTPGLGGSSGALVPPDTSGGAIPGVTTVPGGPSTTTTPGPGGRAFPDQGSSSTFPGASSGASNTR